MRREPIRLSGVDTTGGDYGPRIDALEGRMTIVETATQHAAALAAVAASNAKTAAENSAELLSLWNATKGVAAFCKKHGPRLVAFATGICAAFGYSNPKLSAAFNALF